MNTTEFVHALMIKRNFSWQQFVLDSVLASLGSLLVTTIIFTGHLYPRIPNISIVYLLVVIALASTRSQYAAVLAAVVAFLSFDFFIVPPLYTFVMYHVEEWISLFVFLVDAILTGYLASALRQRAQEASRREHETHILYDLVRTANNEEQPEKQLQVITRAIVDIFSSWSVRDCAILQPDDAETLCVQAGVHLIPLKVGLQTVGVLRLRISDDVRHIQSEDLFLEDQHASNVQTTFFWTFLNQVASLIERAHLRRENLRIEVLQRTDALRAALLSSVSHDLRTPLASIKAAASSLLQKDVQWDEEARRSFTLSIEHEADRLNRLVGNLLDMSRIEDGAIKPEMEWYHIAEVIHDVLSRMRPLLQSHPVQTDIPDDLPPVELDYLQIDQVLTNLIENAIRYTPPESQIDVSVQYEKESESERVVISVADRGPGIPPGDRERVFDKFYRILGGQQNTDYPTTGSGLGLAVCKGLVEAHGGHIWTEPREGGGTVFLVALPVGTFERMPI